MANYRPISILPVVSKIVEKWVAKLLIQHLDKSNNSLHPMQFGFRAHHSTETVNCLFLEKVKGYLDKSSYVGAVFLDLKRAFDTVNHEVLLSKLTYFNFSAQALNWMKSYLSSRKQCVCTRGDRAFAVAAPRLWNSLPLHIRAAQSLNVFKSLLKTHLFSLAFN